VNEREVDELLGSFALDALPDDEAALVREHLEGCATHAARARELRNIALNLQSDAEPMAAPAALRARVLAAVAETPQDAATAEPREAAAARQRNEQSASRITWQPANVPANVRRFPSSAWQAIAAAFVVLAAGLLVWNIVLQRDSGSSFDARNATAVRPLQGNGEQTGSGTVLYFADEHKAVVIGDMPPIAGDKTYQLWSLDDSGTPRSIGLMRPDASGHTNVVVDYDASKASGLAITLEPAGGSPQPTSDPILTAKV
jgi:anti-sigma-K factor RskA